MVKPRRVGGSELKQSASVSVYSESAHLSKYCVCRSIASTQQVNSDTSLPCALTTTWSVFVFHAKTPGFSSDSIVILSPIYRIARIFGGGWGGGANICVLWLNTGALIFYPRMK